MSGPATAPPTASPTGTPTGSLGEALAAWAATSPDNVDVAAVISRIADVGAQLAERLSRNAMLVDFAAPEPEPTANASGDDQKPLDVEAEEMFLSGLAGSPTAASARRRPRTRSR